MSKRRRLIGLLLIFALIMVLALAACGGDEDEIGESHDGVEKIHVQPPKNVRRTSGSARSASPVSV